MTKNTEEKPKPRAKKPRKVKADVLEQEIGDLTADLQRIQADFANYKRRSEEEQSRMVSVGKSHVITTLLPVIDNLERAMRNAPKESEQSAYVKGIQSVVKQLEAALDELGVEKIITLDQEFDPELMNAVAIDDGDGEREVVIEELQAGYQLNGEVVRHAMVKVKRQ
jgi:molecular chaperone GrpE